jgi:hypothetical protein
LGRETEQKVNNLLPKVKTQPETEEIPKAFSESWVEEF